MMNVDILKMNDIHQKDEENFDEISLTLWNITKD